MQHARQAVHKAYVLRPARESIGMSSGLDAVRLIRADESLADLPVILLTARAQESDVETGFGSGADDYITKPFSPNEVIARIRAHPPPPRIPGSWPDPSR